MPQINGVESQDFHPDHYLLQHPIEPNGPEDDMMEFGVGGGLPYDGSGMSQDNVAFLIDMLRRKQKADITRVIREEEKHE